MEKMTNLWVYAREPWSELAESRGNAPFRPSCAARIGNEDAARAIRPA
jgi:hypothetical protein